MVCNRYWFTSVRISQSLHLPSILVQSWCLMSQPATTLPLGWTGIVHYHYWCHWLSPTRSSFEFICLFSGCMDSISPRNRRRLQGIKGWAPMWCGGGHPQLLHVGLYLSSMRVPHKVVIGLKAPIQGLTLFLLTFNPQINKQPQVVMFLVLGDTSTRSLTLSHGVTHHLPACIIFPACR